MLIPGIYILLLLAAAVVLAFVLEFVSFVRDPLPVSASGDESSHPKLDRRIFRRVAVTLGVAACLLVAGFITMDVVYPHSSVRWRLIHPYLLLGYGAAFYLVALLYGVKPRQPVLLVCLTLPGLVVMPSVFLSAIVMSNNVIVAAIMVPVVFFLQPAVWILMFIGIGQARLLGRPGTNFTPGGLVRLLLILAAYLFGTFGSAPLQI